MRSLLSTLIVFLTFFAPKGFAITDAEIAEITERTGAYSTDELVERRQVLLAMLDLDDPSDEEALEMLTDAAEDLTEEIEVETNPEVRQRLLLELSIVEQLLVLLGVIVAGDVTDSTSTPPDTVFPIITILGGNPATVELGTTYVDAGATTNEGTISIISNNIDTNLVGSYSIVYSATDAAGNTSTATRTVNVVDTTAPEVTLTGAATVTVELGGTYTELGATATDASGTVAVVITGTVDTDAVGSYTVIYSSTDASGNEGTATRTVNVVDTTAPVITSAEVFEVEENRFSWNNYCYRRYRVLIFSIWF